MSNLLTNDEKEKIKKLPKWAQEIIDKLITCSYSSTSLIEIPKPYSADEIKEYLKDKRLGALLVGYFYNSYSGRITKGCTSTIYHSTCTPNKTSTQNMALNMYKTYEDAKTAMAFSIELDMKRKLRATDEGRA